MNGNWRKLTWGDTHEKASNYYCISFVNHDDDFLFEETENTASSNDESKSDEEVMNLLEQFGFDDSEEASDTKTAI